MGTGVGGTLGYFGLGDWWLATFTKEERDYIEEKHTPMGGLPGVTLTKGNGANSGTAAGLLISLSTWFMGPGDRHLAAKMLDKADSLAGSNIIDRHFVYSEMVEMFYKDRAQPGALDAAILACECQIAIAPQAQADFESGDRGNAAATGHPYEPDYYARSHRGFVQLAIIREKQGDYAEALRLCREAQGQGWKDGHDDWSKRIARLEKRASKA